MLLSVRTLVAALAVLGSLQTSSVKAHLPEPVFAAVQTAIVRVAATHCVGPDRTSNGFLVRIGDQDWIVTNAHAVAGCSIAVEFNGANGPTGNPVSATVGRLSRKTDLALLTPSSLPAGVRPLSLRKAPVNVADDLIAVGYLVAPAITDMPLDLSHGIVTVEDLVGSKIVARLRSAGMAIAKLKIHLLNGDLQPGSSGAPIVDNQGSVVGVAEGGLSLGFAGTCWAVPVDNVRSLAQSHTLDSFSDDELENYARLLGSDSEDVVFSKVEILENRSNRNPLYFSVMLAGEAGLFLKAPTNTLWQTGIELGLLWEGMQFPSAFPHHSFGLRMQASVYPLGYAYGSFKDHDGRALEDRTVRYSRFSIDLMPTLRFRRLRTYTIELSTGIRLSTLVQKFRDYSPHAWPSYGFPIRLRIGRVFNVPHAFGFDIGTAFERIPQPSRSYSGAFGSVDEAQVAWAFSSSLGLYYEY